jgi:ATP synthase (C/AC39) subunit
MSVGWESLMFNVKDGFLGAQLIPAQVFSSTARAATNCSVRSFTVNLSKSWWWCTDAVVRGHRSGLLTSADYNNLAQCESLDDIKLNLVNAITTALLLAPCPCATCCTASHCSAYSVVVPICVQSATDYGPYVQNLPSPLHTTTLVEACTQLLVDQWLYLRANVRVGLADHLQSHS